jgi:glycosyltransferase involved in cell wall biosynthesis
MGVFFSIVIPTFNRANDLKRCFESLLAQTYQNFEVLVCDDGSTDNTKDIVNEFTNQLNIHYIWEANWGGPARPRNNGIKSAKGEWICFLDSDDYWYPDKLTVCIDYLNDSDAVYHHFDVVGKDVPWYRNKFTARPVDNNNAFLDLLLHWNGIITSGVVVRKSVIDNIICFDEDKKLIGVEDFDFWLKLAKVTNRFTLVPKYLGAYYMTEISLTRKFNDPVQHERYLLNKHRNSLTEKQYQDLQVELDVLGGVKLLMNRERKNANKFLIKAIGESSKLTTKLKALLFFVFGDSAFAVSKILFTILKMKRV